MLVNTDGMEEACEPISGLESGRDRRWRPRLRLALPLVLFRSGETGRIETETVDVSCDSFYCVLNHRFSPDDRLECELTIPGDKLGSAPPEDALCLCCRLRVVRVVENGPQLGYGMACQFEDYTIHRVLGELTQV